MQQNRMRFLQHMQTEMQRQNMQTEMLRKRQNYENDLKNKKFIYKTKLFLKNMLKPNYELTDKDIRIFKKIRNKYKDDPSFTQSINRINEMYPKIFIKKKILKL